MSARLHILGLLMLLCAATFAQQTEVETDTLENSPAIRFMYHPNNWKKDIDTMRYVLEGAQDIWYNGYDGMKFGVHLKGGKADKFHVFDLHLWGNSGLGQYGLPEGTDRRAFMPLSFLAEYRTSLHRFWRHSGVEVSGRALDGLYGYGVALTKQNRKQNTTWSLAFKSMYRAANNGMPYLLDRVNWDVGQWNNSFNLSFDHRYGYGSGKGNVNVALRSSALGSDGNYHYLRVAATNYTEVWMLKLNTRAFLQLGYGTDWAAESLLYSDKASPEEMMDNKFTRSAGIIPAQWATYRQVQNHFHHGGGLNLRGYAGYLSPEVTDNGVVIAYSGANGAAVNVELQFDRLLGSDHWPARKYISLNTYFFGDVGMISKSAPDAAPVFAMPRADAGLGIALTVKQWGPMEKLAPFTIRFDMPLVVSRPAAVQPEPWAFRWVLGVGRSF